MAERNYEGIQFADLRKTVDVKFNAVHDKLENCYRTGTPFVHNGKDFGVLDKDKFDKLHGLIWHLHSVAFHAANMLRLPANRIPEDKYRYERDETGAIATDRLTLAQAKIAELKASGIELTT